MKNKLIGIMGFILLLIACGIPVYYTICNTADSNRPFYGRGTVDCPYLIDGLESLLVFRDKVNSGENFSGEFFLQTVDIDLIDEEWIPIGVFGSNRYFQGVYDGNGHHISNLVCVDHDSNNGLFGLLNGTVMNLYIDNCFLNGACVGGVTSHGSDNTCILNCYVEGEISALSRAGGICDNLGKGRVINCGFVGTLEAPIIGGISSYSAGYIFHCAANTIPTNIYNDGRVIECVDLSDKSEVISYINTDRSHIYSTGIIDDIELSVWE